MSWLFWLIVGFAIEWAIEMWYWRGQRANRFTAPLEARIRELEEEVRRASLIGAAGRAPSTSSRAGAASAASAASVASTASAPSGATSTPAEVDPPAAPDASAPAADVPIVTSRRSPRRDDLKAITGIGGAFEEKLFEAGITTYGALAGTSAEEIAAIIRPEDWQNYDFYDWIRQAAELARKV